VAFYDALLPSINSQGIEPQTDLVGGWRKVEADGKKFIDPDSFVVQSKFAVDTSEELEFENQFNKEKGALEGVDGSVGFYLMRRDANKADDGFNYIGKPNTNPN
jgi:hypothetical protein